MRYRSFARIGWQINAVSLGGAYLMGPDPDQALGNTGALVRRA